MKYEKPEVMKFGDAVTAIQDPMEKPGDVLPDNDIGQGTASAYSADE
ncbi:MAG: hypothetical protein WAN12_15720 [Candidatus Acidiferrum sp.]